MDQLDRNENVHCSQTIKPLELLDWSETRHEPPFHIRSIGVNVREGSETRKVMAWVRKEWGKQRRFVRRLMPFQKLGGSSDFVLLYTQSNFSSINLKKSFNNMNNYMFLQLNKYVSLENSPSVSHVSCIWLKS